MPVTIHEFPTQEKKPVPESETKWKVKCRQCSFAAENLKTGNAAEDVARHHSVVYGHDVEIRFSINDCLSDVIRANDPRG